MEFTALLQELSNPDTRIYGNSMNDCDLQLVRLLRSSEKVFDPSYLYVTTTDILPAPDTPCRFVVIACGPETDFRQFRNCIFTVIHMGDSIALPDLFEAVSNILTETQTLQAGMHLMINALLSDKGLQHLVDTAANVLRNPIYVVDLKFKYLAISGGGAQTDAFFRTEAASGNITDEGIKFIQSHQLDNRVRESNKPIYFTNPIVGCGVMVAGIKIQGIEVGHIMLQELTHEFEPVDSDLFARFSQLLAIEMQKDSIFSANKGLMFSFFLSDLIKNPKVDAELLKHRLELTGYKFKSVFYILAIPQASYQSSKVRLELILHQLKNILPGSMYVIHEDIIIFLINKDTYQDFTSHELDRLTSFLLSSNLKAGVSNFYEDLKDTKRFFDEAVSSVELGMRLAMDGPIYYYRDCYIYEMLEVFAQHDRDVRFLIHPGLMRLYYYDKKKGTDLTETLHIFLQHTGQTALVSDLLHIHKNTLLYRMNKIREITGCDFEKGEDYISFGISFKIMKYLTKV